MVLGDLEFDDDLVLPLRNDGVVDVGEEVALLGVGVLDLLHAAAHGRHAEDRVGLDLDGLVQLVVVELVVALVGHLLDVRLLPDDEPQHDAAVAGGQVDLDVLEETGVPQGMDVAREVLDLEEMPGLLAQVREHVLAAHPAVADDLDGGDGQALGLLRQRRRQAHRGLGRGGRLRGRGAGVGSGRGRAGVSRRSAAVCRRGCRDQSGAPGWWSGGGGCRGCPPRRRSPAIRVCCQRRDAEQRREHCGQDSEQSSHRVRAVARRAKRSEGS